MSFDVLRRWLLLSVIMIFSGQAKAFDPWDFEGKVAARTHNFGAVGVATLSYNHRLWQGYEDKDVFYGYVRPRFELASSMVVNAATAEVQVFPISIFGVTFGYSMRQRDYQFRSFDCSQVSCSGRIERSYAAAHMLYKYQKMVLAGTLELQRTQYDSANVRYADSKYMVLLGPGPDELLYTWAFVGYVLSPTFTAGYFTEWGEVKSGDRREAHYLLGKWQLEKPWLLTVGVGGIGTTQLARGVDIFTQLSWRYGEKIGYF